MVIKILLKVSLLRLSTLFFFKKSRIQIILSLLLFLSSVLNANIIVSIFETLSSKFDITVLFNISLLVLSILTVLRKIFPIYTPLNILIKKHYPISLKNRFLIHLGDEFLNVFFINTVFLILLVVSKLGLFNYIVLIQVFSVLIISVMFRRILGISIISSFSAIKVYLVVIATFAYLFYFGLCLYLNVTDFIKLFPFVLITIILYRMEALAISQENKEKQFIYGKNWLNLLLYNPLLRAPSIMVILVKILMLLTITITGIKKGSMEELKFIAYLFFLPTTIFTYMANNIWGLNRKLWLTFDIVGISYFNMSMNIFKLLLPIILIDLFITLLFLSLNTELFLNGILAYISSFYIFFVLGLFFSAVTPLKRNKVLHLGSNTSLVATLFFIVITISFSLIEVNIWFYCIPIFYLLIAILIHYFLGSIYQDARRKIYVRLFST
jgi:hypothetical protein